jgi:hypothetical protein
MKEVAAAGLRRNDPAAHDRQGKDGYITGAPAHRPAVISVNMFAAALAVDEFLARLHPFREEPNSSYASVTFSLASMELITDPEEGICDMLGGSVGMGDTTYVVQEDGFEEQAAMLCPCGCRRVLQMNLLRDERPYWHLTRHEDNTTSLQRGSHFWFRRGRVEWCRGAVQGGVYEARGPA